MATSSAHLHTDSASFAAIGTVDVRRAGEARVEAVDRAQDLDRLVGNCHRSADQGRLVCTALTFRVLRRRVPGARHDALVVVDLLVLDVDPVAERAARRLGEAEALAVLRPGRLLPVRRVRGRWCRRPSRCSIRRSNSSISQCTHSCDSRPRAAVRPSVEKSAVAGSFSWPSASSTTSLISGAAARVADQHARQRADLHRVALPARRLQPRVGAVLVEVLVRRLRTGVVRLGVALERMQLASLPSGIAVPRVRDLLGDLRGVLAVDGQHLAEVLAEDRAAREAERLLGSPMPFCGTSP